MNAPSWLMGNRLLNVVMLSLIAAAGGAEGGQTQLCCFNNVFCIYIPPFLEEAAEGPAGFGTVSATIIDLTFKGLPIDPDPLDTDPKDTNVTKAKLDTPAFGNVKRMLMRAKKDGAAHRMIYSREFSGDFSGSIVITVDPDAGALVDGQSAGYYEVAEDPNAPSEGGDIFLRMTATWDAVNQGLSISAEDNTGALGTPVVFPGSTEVALEMDWNNLGRFLNAFPLDAGFEEGYAAFGYNDAVTVPVGVPFFMGFGVEQLGKAARFYFTNLAITSASLGSGGGEVAAAMYATVALSYIETAWSLALDGFDTTLVKSNLDVGMTYLDAAMDELETAMDAGTVHGSAETKLAMRSLKKGMKGITKGGKLADKLVKKEKTPTQSLANKCNKARWQALLIQAQLFGFKSKSIDKYFDTLVVYAPDFF